MNITVKNGGITAPSGFTASGVVCGIKNGGKKRDVAVIYSEVPTVTAGVFTTNKVKAAPLVLTQERVAKGDVRAVIVNSGNANACTGQQGMADALQMAELTATALGIAPEQVAVSSTGVIGVHMPMNKMVEGIPLACQGLHKDGSSQAAEAIMTTDLVPKEIALGLEIGGKTVTIGGIAKGSGMIHPNMATMLAFITTDAAITKLGLEKALKEATDSSFNMITVDGDQSTNDMALAMSNGLAGNSVIGEEGEQYDMFLSALKEVCEYLAKEIAKDGEGATKLLEIVVKGAQSLQDARTIARTVAKSSLVKTAMFGEDANWGRIVSAVGYSEAECDPDLIDVYLGNIPVALQGMAAPFSEEEAKVVLEQSKINMMIDLHLGNYEATAWGCDLSYDYVKINGSYRT